MVVFAVAGGPQRVRWKYIFTWSGQCHIVGESTEFCSTYFILRDEVCLPTLCVHMNAGSSHLTCDRWTTNPPKYEQNFSRRWEHRPWQRAILVSPLQCRLRWTWKRFESVWIRSTILQCLFNCWWINVIRGLSLISIDNGRCGRCVLYQPSFNGWFIDTMVVIGKQWLIGDDKKFNGYPTIITSRNCLY